MPLTWVKTCIYSLGGDGFDFCLFENPFSNVVFCTFSLTLEHSDFHFPFDILAQMMNFLAHLCRDFMTEHLAMETMTTSEKSTGDYLENFVINDLF